jgi:prepilin-type N-terminal cleavage/methylation domain-containing protein
MTLGRNTARLPNGFTRLELLIVTAIWGVLAALTLTACLRAKANAHETKCRSNLRQLALAMHMYLADSSGRFPKHARVIATGRDSIEFWGDGWVKKLLPCATPQVSECPSDPGYRRYLAGSRNAGELDGALSDYEL